MPRARRKADRLRQVFNWLCDQYPLGPVKLSLVGNKTQEQKENFGWVEKGDHGLVIFLVKTHPLDVLIESLLHEYAHAMIWPKGAKHQPKVVRAGEWSDHYGMLFERFYEQAGWEDSHSADY